MSRYNRLKLRMLWSKAMQYDRIPFNSKYVIFSSHNPWAEKYNNAMRDYLTGR